MNNHDVKTTDHFSERQIARLAAAQEAKRILGGFPGIPNATAVIELADWLLGGNSDD